MRAHMNCVENLPIYTAIVVALMATGLQGSTIDHLAIAILPAHIGQTLIAPARNERARQFDRAPRST